LRDLFLGRRTTDLDVVGWGPVQRLARCFADKTGGHFFMLDEAREIARVTLEKNHERWTVDFALGRGKSIRDDLRHRDFTWNAMALPLGHGKQELIDPLGGFRDLKARKVRAVSTAVFHDDPVRLLRAVRFAATLDMGLESGTARLLSRQAALIRRSPGERIREELFKILGADRAAAGLEMMRRSGLLRVLFPELADMAGVDQGGYHYYDVWNHTLKTIEHARHLAAHPTRYFQPWAGRIAKELDRETAGGRRQRDLLYLAALFHDAGKPVTRKRVQGETHFWGHEDAGIPVLRRTVRFLAFSQSEQKLLETMVREHLRPGLLSHEPRVSPRAVYRLFRATEPVTVLVLLHSLADYWATRKAGRAARRAQGHLAFLRRLFRGYYSPRSPARPVLLLNGHEVMKTLGIGPGPRVGAVLEKLREARAVGRVRTRDEAVAFIRRL